MGSNAPQKGGLTDAVRNIVERWVRGGEFSTLLGRANANADAQKTSDGLGIQNIRRGIATKVLTNLGANITVSSGSMAALSTPAELEVTLSGRPVRVALTATIAAGSGGLLVIDVFMRGQSLTGVANGLIYTDNDASIVTQSAEIMVMNPEPGQAIFSVRAFIATANGTIHVDQYNRLELSVVEQ